ncbi:MAG: lipoprotein [Leptospirales bacterium]|jgi:hypothetical protein
MNQRINFKLTTGAIALAILAAGGAACHKEQVRVVSLHDADARRVGIGFIENRDIRYSPFSSKNFSDMLSFELMQSGYRLSDVDFAALRQSLESGRSPGETRGETPVQDARPGPNSNADADDAVRGEGGEDPAADQESAPDAGVAEKSKTTETKPDAKASEDEESYADGILPKKSDSADDRTRNIDPSNINDGTRDLLPLRLRNIAGELEPRERVVDPENRRLSGEEIARLARSNKLDFYIQGAIGRTETGLVLETEENTLVFLEVFDPRGERVGAINISINDETLKRSSFLQQISAEIIEAFDREIGR